MFSYEWSIWNNQGPFVYEYALLAALMGANTALTATRITR